MVQGKPGSDVIKYTLFFLLLLVLAGLFVIAFDRIPLENTTLAFDWRSLWVGLENGNLKYHSGSGVRNPPWSMLFVLPLGLLSFRASWALLTLLTIAVLTMSVPRGGDKKLWALSVILLLTSYPAIRHTADGNFEGLVIAGLLLILRGHRREQILPLVIGTLTATAKVQEVWLFFPILAVYIFRSWPVRRWLVAAAIVVAVVVATLLWRGQDWWEAMTGIPQFYSVVNASLSAALTRLGAFGWLISLFWLAVMAATLLLCLRGRSEMSREKTGLLVAASLLLAPYAAGNSLLTVLAIGIIPMLATPAANQEAPARADSAEPSPRRWLPAPPGQWENIATSLLLIALINLAYPVTLLLPTSDVYFQLLVYHPTVMLLIIWGTLSFRLLRQL
jgi:hypothetical protein